MNLIAILLTCHNRKDKTVECLFSLYNIKFKEKFSFDVFLVDDNSSDGTSDIIRKNFPLVKIIKGSGKLFWNRGMHCAWENAIKLKKYDYYLWLNDDVILDPRALNTMVNDSKIKKNSIICGVLKSKHIENTISYGGKNINGEFIIPNGIPNECKYINGNTVLVPKKIVEKIGILDPFYPHAIGDYEYGLRAIKSGFKCMITSTYIGYCEPNDSPPKWCLSETKFIDRIKSLYSPLGNSHPYYFFIYEYKYFGIMRALKHFVSIHLRVIFPKLWH